MPISILCLGKIAVLSSAEDECMNLTLAIIFLKSYYDITFHLKNEIVIPYKKESEAKKCKQ